VARSMPSLWVQALVIVVGLLLGWFLFGYHYKGHHVCFDCKAPVWFDRRGLGNPDGAHVEFQNSTRESSSFARTELFPADHVHRLVFGQSSNSWLFDGWICSLGSGASNGFSVRLNLDDGFREFVRAKVASGSLKREDAAAVVAVPRDWQSLERYRKELSIQETRADYSAAIDLGARLMKEYDDSVGPTEREWRMWPEK
jgi:hypothetical protein